MPKPKSPLKELPIPDRTRQRIITYRDAATLYIHGKPGTGARFPTMRALAKEVGIDEDAMRNVAVSDKWEEFRQGLLVEAYRAGPEPRGLAIMGRSRGEKERQAIAREAKRQGDLVAKLEAEAVRIAEALPEYKPGSSDHSRAIASLKLLRQELEHISGKSAYDQESQSRFTAALSIETERAKKAGGGINPGEQDSRSDSVVIDGDALPSYDAIPEASQGDDSASQGEQVGW